MCLKRGWCGEGHTRRKGNRGTLGAVRAGTRVVLRAPTEEAIANLASWKKCDSLQQSAIDDAVRIASQRGTLRIATRHATSLQTPESPMGQLSVLLGRVNRGATRWVGKGGNGAAQHTDFDYPTREGKGGHSRCSAPPLLIINLRYSID